MNRGHFARLAFVGSGALALFIALIAAPLASAQGSPASADVAGAPLPSELEKIVAPIALYPDDLVAIILPASTNPLQIVQADRYLEKRKKDPGLAIDENWDDSVKALVNYPEVIKQMSADLDWTAELGEAVVDDQGAVLDAVQAFRRKVQAAGNLKTDAKQVVEVDQGTVKIVPADPQVIYVPQYNPSTVIVASSTPVYGYWPSPYPVYYYPYPPGAALATGLIWGAAMGAAWNGGRWNTNWGGGNNSNNNITINRGDTNINRGNINTGNVNRPAQRPAGGGGTAWKSDKKPGQVASGAGRPSGNYARPGDARPGGAAGGAGARPSMQPTGGMGQGGAASRGSGGASVSGTAARSGGGGGGASRDAFGGYGSGSGARADSSRGAASRSAMSSQGARPSAGAPAGGGGARAGGGGGGARAGGGGGGGRGGGGGGGRR